MIVLSTLVWGLSGHAKWDRETLLFQLLLPGIDEEMMFRGVLLGLLLTALKERIALIGSPAIGITAVLFGCSHAVTVGAHYSIHFDPFYFLQTALAGYVWGWITFKSRSILLAIVSHNLCNFFGTLATMIK
ncbi:CPBP family intramembrane glutamic endopeptidase [Filimonas lacunae]|uniref:CPBP family intramembrane glutamic endopeptidase n=1 Tax=Filimonas lacunae TaxID=477680 RepID=UPI0007D71E7B|nr:hypothetical protein FLA_3076 [Filimonas lacunae]